VRVKARHILLSFPDDATDAQRDSVFALAEEIRERAASGEDFSALAREYSDDQGTAQQGGDLGWFERGSMVEP
ncbi:MAG: molecular chaperone SurA, partial [Gammaproteobacteria bacterium]|nr:molecular chaperone SurA [Gammaproteobacteria bacterium]